MADERIMSALRSMQVSFSNALLPPGSGLTVQGWLEGHAATLCNISTSR